MFPISATHLNPLQIGQGGAEHVTLLGIIEKDVKMSERFPLGENIAILARRSDIKPHKSQ